MAPAGPGHTRPDTLAASSQEGLASPSLSDLQPPSSSEAPLRVTSTATSLTSYAGEHNSERSELACRWHRYGANGRSASYEMLTLAADGKFTFIAEGIYGDGGGICGGRDESSGEGTWSVVGGELVLSGSFNFDAEMVQMGYGGGEDMEGDYRCGPFPPRVPDATADGHDDPAWRQWRRTAEFLQSPPTRFLTLLFHKPLDLNTLNLATRRGIRKSRHFDITTSHKVILLRCRYRVLAI